MLRGALTFGEVRLSEHYLLGPSVLRAVEVEKELALPLICAPSADLKDAGILDQTGIIVDYLPTKEGIIQGMDLVSMPYDMILRTVDRYLEETSISGPQNVAAVWLTYKERILQHKRQRGSPDGKPGISANF